MSESLILYCFLTVLYLRMAEAVDMGYAGGAAAGYADCWVDVDGSSWAAEAGYYYW